MTPPLKKQDVEVIEKTTPYRGYARLDVYRLRHRLYEGGWGGVISREILERGHAAAAILYDPDQDSLVMLEQFRPGAYAALAAPWWGDDFSPWLVEVVAGIIEAGESGEDVIRREAVEEAGCTVLDLVPATRWLASPGICSETVILYCARVDARGVGGVHGLSHEGEDIRVTTVSSEHAFRWLDEGRIANATAMIALHWFRHHRESLRRRWQGA